MTILSQEGLRQILRCAGLRICIKRTRQAMTVSCNSDQSYEQPVHEQLLFLSPQHVMDLTHNLQKYSAVIKSAEKLAFVASYYSYHI